MSYNLNKPGFRRIASRICGVFAIMVVAALSSSCVHEFPKTPENRKVTLRIHHELPWDLFEWTYPKNTRANDAALCARYIIGIYPEGATTEIAYSKTILTRADLERVDFSVDIDVPVGRWDIRIWTDNSLTATGLSPYYNADDFTSITYASPFIGGDSRKDAFVGNISMTVPDVNSEDWGRDTYDVELHRPLTAYAFIATDLEEFVEQEITRTRNEAASAGVPPANLPPISLSDYAVKISYSGFLPSVYHPFSDRPVDSATGVSFNTTASQLNKSEALLGHDFVFINGKESTVRTELDLYHKDGTHIARVSSFDIPVKRNRCTIVRGEFLTSKATGSTGIDPGFDGDFNIEYK